LLLFREIGKCDDKGKEGIKMQSPLIVEMQFIMIDVASAMFSHSTLAAQLELRV